MERESQSATTRLLNTLGENLPRTNFYRFCQLLEQWNPHMPCPGSQQSPRYDVIRFRPHHRMGFPAGELKVPNIILSKQRFRPRFASPLWGFMVWNHLCRQPIWMILPKGRRGRMLPLSSGYFQSSFNCAVLPYLA